MKLDGIYPAILADNLKELKKRLSAGANPNETDFFTGRTMLQVAIEKNNPEIIKELVMAGADVDYTYRLKQYPMHHEAVRAAVDTLAAERAQGKNSKGSPEQNIKTLRDRVIESIQNKESPKESAKESAKESVKQYAIKESVVSIVQNNKHGKLRALLANGANPNEMDLKDGDTALEIAVQRKAKPSIIIELILYGADTKNVAGNALVKEIQNIMLDIQQAAAKDLGNMIEPVKDAEQKKSTISRTSNKKSPRKDQNKPNRTGPKF